YPNYILSCSPKAKMRRNMAFTSMLNMPAGFAPLLFGFIADTVGAAADNKKFGFQVSFLVAAAFLIAALLVVQLMLPARPQQQEPDVSSPHRLLIKTFSCLAKRSRPLTCTPTTARTTPER